MSVKYTGRRKPYTQIGISRVPCSRCGKPSYHQWQICANGNRNVGICLDCDVLLNKRVLKFMRIPNAEQLMLEYEFLQRYYQEHAGVAK